jgi:hypothetical protein
VGEVPDFCTRADGAIRIDDGGGMCEVVGHGVELM